MDCIPRITRRGSAGIYRRPRILWAAGPSLVCVALLVASCSSTSAPPSTRATTTSLSSTSTTSSPATSTTLAPPAGGAVPSGFLPGPVTFVSTATGYAIGVASSCPGGQCVALVRTTDGGGTWVGLTPPTAGYVAHGVPAASGLPGVDEVRFADPLDGWVFGPALFATHDGGRTWQQIDIDGSVVALETSGGYVDAVVSPCSGEAECAGSLRLEQAPVTGGGFVTVRTGPSVMSAGITALDLSLHSPVGFALLGLGDLYATEYLANPDGWNAFGNPCASESFTLTAIVAPNTTTLYSLCSGNGAAGSMTKTVVETQNGKSTVAGSTPPEGDAEAVAATASGTLVVSTASGASFLYRSTDGGRTWSTVLTEDDGGMGFNDLGFTTSTQGVAIHGIPGPPGNEITQLLMTHDAGASWQIVPIG
jgi:photosystem II stability/assembly factor-like uncharacterized protein